MERGSRDAWSRLPRFFFGLRWHDTALDFACARSKQPKRVVPPHSEMAPMPISLHIPVLPDAILRLLEPQPGQVIVDCTVGAGGHARLFAQKVAPTGKVIGLDQDATMLDLARPGLAGLPVTLVHRNFEELPTVLKELQVGPVDAIVADLGFSSDQLANAERGLSFQLEGPLDMRLDPTRGEPASALLRRLPESQLADLFWQFGEERHSRRIARRIVEVRQTTPLTTTGQLAELVRRCVPRSKANPIDPATRVFQALRIAVNDELAALGRFLVVLPECPKPGGRAAQPADRTEECGSPANDAVDDERAPRRTGAPVGAALKGQPQ